MNPSNGLITLSTEVICMIFDEILEGPGPKPNWGPVARRAKNTDGSRISRQNLDHCKFLWDILHFHPGLRTVAKLQIVHPRFKAIVDNRNGGKMKRAQVILQKLAERNITGFPDLSWTGVTRKVEASQRRKYLWDIMERIAQQLEYLSDLPLMYPHLVAQALERLRIVYFLEDTAKLYGTRVSEL